MRFAFAAFAAVAVSAVIPANAEAFQIYAPWTSLGDAETWYDVGPDWTKEPNYSVVPSIGTPSTQFVAPSLAPPVVPTPPTTKFNSIGTSGLVAPSAIPIPQGAFYALTTVRERSTKAGLERFVSIESRHTQDPNAQGCAGGFGDLGLPTFSKARHPSLAPGQPFWVSTPAVTDGWVFVTVVEQPYPYSNFMMAGRLYAKRQTPGATDICSGWESSWQELVLGMTTRNEDERGRPYSPPRQMVGQAGSAPSALTLPPGVPGGGNTYVCVDPMHDFSQPVSAQCFVRRRGQAAWTPFGLEIDASLGYPIGRPSLAYDRCRRRVVVAGTDSSTRVGVNFASAEVRNADGVLIRRDGGYALLPRGRASAGSATLFQRRESCDLDLVVRVAAHTQFFTTAIPESIRMGCRATGPGPSVGCVNGAEYVTATWSGEQPRINIGWIFGTSPLPIRGTDRGIAMAFAPRTQDGAIVVLDRNDKGRNYMQFAVGAKGWANPSTYFLR